MTSVVRIAKPSIDPTDCTEPSCTQIKGSLQQSNPSDHYFGMVCNHCGVISAIEWDDMFKECRLGYVGDNECDEQARLDTAATRHHEQEYTDTTSLAYRMEKKGRTAEERLVDIKQKQLNKAARFFDRRMHTNVELRSFALDLFARYQRKARFNATEIVMAACVLEASDHITAGCSLTADYVARVCFPHSNAGTTASAINKKRNRVLGRLDRSETRVVPRWVRVKRFVQGVCVQLSPVLDSYENTRLDAQMKLTKEQLETDAKLQAKKDLTVACAIMVAALGRVRREDGTIISPALMNRMTQCSNGSISSCVKIMNLIKTIL
jgi:hypothetical protein